MTPPDPSSAVPASTVKRRFLELLKQVASEHSMITITRNGVAAGVLMSVQEYESLIETVEILADPEVMKRLRRARRGLARRKVLAHDQVWPKT